MIKQLSYKDKEETSESTYDFIFDVDQDKNKINVKLMIDERKSAGISTIQFDAEGKSIEEAKARLVKNMSFLSMFALPVDITAIASRDFLALAI